MSAWLILTTIVLVSVALIADHSRNVRAEVGDVRDLDVVPAPKRDALTRASTRPIRVNGRSGSARRQGPLPVRRSERTAPRR